MALFGQLQFGPCFDNWYSHLTRRFVWRPEVPPIFQQSVWLLYAFLSERFRMSVGRLLLHGQWGSVGHGVATLDRSHEPHILFRLNISYITLLTINLSYIQTDCRPLYITQLRRLLISRSLPFQHSSISYLEKSEFIEQSGFRSSFASFFISFLALWVPPVFISTPHPIFLPQWAQQIKAQYKTYSLPLSTWFSLSPSSAQFFYSLVSLP